MKLKSAYQRATCKVRCRCKKKASKVPNKNSESKLAHQWERNKMKMQGKPRSQPIRIEYSFKKPPWFWLGFVESTHLIGLLLGFFQNFLVLWTMWSDWSASFSLDHPIYTPASRGSNNAFDYFNHFLDVIQGLASNKIIPCLIPWAWKLQYWVTCVSREVKGQLLPPAPSFRRLVETKKAVGFLCYWALRNCHSSIGVVRSSCVQEAIGISIHQQKKK